MKIVVIATQGIISNSIELEQDGKPMSYKNNLKNWQVIHDLSQNHLIEVTWELRDMGGRVIESKPWLESPTYTYRRRQLKNRKGGAK